MSSDFSIIFLLSFFTLFFFLSDTLASAKAMVSEVSDDRFQAFAVSIVGAAWSLGYVIGPTVSGAIADPVGQYNLTISSKTGFLVMDFKNLFHTNSAFITLCFLW